MKKTKKNTFEAYLDNTPQGNLFHRLVDNMESMGFDFKKAAEELNATKSQQAEQLAEQLDEVVEQVEETTEQLQEAFTAQNVSYTQQYIQTK